LPILVPLRFCLLCLLCLLSLRMTASLRWVR